MNHGKFTREEARALGYTIDDHCYPPVAYKGGRMQPVEWHYTYTELETELITAIRVALALPGERADEIEVELKQALVDLGVKL